MVDCQVKMWCGMNHAFHIAVKIILWHLHFMSVLSCVQEWLTMTNSCIFELPGHQCLQILRAHRGGLINIWPFQTRIAECAGLSVLASCQTGNTQLFGSLVLWCKVPGCVQHPAPGAHCVPQHICQESVNLVNNTQDQLGTPFWLTNKLNHASGCVSEFTFFMIGDVLTHTC